YDRTLTYMKLRIAFDALWRCPCACLMATNRERCCPLPEGRGEPDAGAVVAALEVATGRRGERHFGEPNTSVVDEAVSCVGIRAKHVIFVGDSLAPHIKMAVTAGNNSGLVLTGDASREDLHGIPAQSHPTHILKSLTELIPT